MSFGVTAFFGEISERVILVKTVRYILYLFNLFITFVPCFLLRTISRSKKLIIATRIATTETQFFKYNEFESYGDSLTQVVFCCYCSIVN